MAPQVQIQRVGQNTWQITRVLEFQPSVFQYDMLARVVLAEGSMYYVELAYWEKGEQCWARRPRAYQLLRGAMRVASDYALGKVEGS